mgnify:CR=1 FL=1
MKKGFTKKRYQLILLIIPCIIILAYIYFTQSNKIDTIKLKRRLFTTYSPSKNHQLNVYTADTNKENASVLVELKNDQRKTYTGSQILHGHILSGNQKTLFISMAQK